MLFLGSADDLPHVDIGGYLMVCAEPKGLMQGIGKVCPCVCRRIPELFTGTHHHHVTQGADHLVTCVFTAEFLLKYPEYKERYATGEEVRPYAVLPLQEYRTCLEFCLHYAEAFLCFPAFPVDVIMVPGSRTI